MSLDIDDKLLAEAMRAGGFRTKKEAVEAGLRLLIAAKGQQSSSKLRGKVGGQIDRDRSRSGR